MLESSKFGDLFMKIKAKKTKKNTKKYSNNISFKYLKLKKLFCTSFFSNCVDFKSPKFNSFFEGVFTKKILKIFETEN